MGSIVVIVVDWRCVHLKGHIFNKAQSQPSFVAHEAHSGFIDHLVKNHEVMVLGLVLRALEMVVQVVFKLGLLLVQIRKVNEEPGAHVTFHGFNLFVGGWSVTSAKEVTILQ